MLVLTRRVDEEVVATVPGLDSPVRIKIVEIRGGKVKLGITADRQVSIDRDEVYRRRKLPPEGTVSP